MKTALPCPSTVVIAEGRISADPTSNCQPPMTAGWSVLMSFMTDHLSRGRLRQCDPHGGDSGFADRIAEARLRVSYQAAEAPARPEDQQVVFEAQIIRVGLALHHTAEWVKENMLQDDFINLLGYWEDEARQQRKEAERASKAAKNKLKKPRTMGDKE